MLEPNIYTISLIMNILLVVELNGTKDWQEDLCRVKSWRDVHPTEMILPKYENTNVIDAYHSLFDYSSEELFSSETLRPVNYFLGWFQTILWMFSRTIKSIKPFIKPKLVRLMNRII